MAGCTFLDPSARRPSEPVSVLQIHGTVDEVVPYGGGALGGGLPVVSLLPGALSTVRIWAMLNGCSGFAEDPVQTMDLDLAVAGPDASVARYTSCPPGGAVELWTVHGTGHGPTLTSGTSSSQMAERIVDWLLSHPKP